MNKPHTSHLKAHAVVMTPQTLPQVEALLTKKLLWKLGASGRAACQRIVRDAINALPEKYPYASQTRAYQLENARLEKLYDSI